jgi:transcriptional regulator with XRE-family HTH domain
MRKPENTKGDNVQITMVEEFTSTPEGMAAFQQERVILDVAVLIRALLKEQNLAKAELAIRLGKSKAFITQLLNGRANMTLRTLSDVMCSLNRSLRISAGPLEARAPGERPFMIVWHNQVPQNRTFNVDVASLSRLANIQMTGGGPISPTAPTKTPGVA